MGMLGTVRTRKKLGRWSGRCPPRSPARMAPPKGMSPGSIQRLNGECKRMVDVRLDTPPQDQPWSRIGPICSSPNAARPAP